VHGCSLRATNSFAAFSVTLLNKRRRQSLHNPDVAYIGDGRFAIAADFNSHIIYAAIYNSNTGSLTQPIPVYVAPAPDAITPRVAATQDGGFVVTWTVSNGPAPDTDSYSVPRPPVRSIRLPGDEFVVIP